MGKLDEVVITEVSPRDGFQSLPQIVPTEEKIDFINQILNCGFKQVEVTSFVHPKAIPQMSDADEVLQRIKRPTDVTLRALVPNLHGLERAIKAKVDKVKLMLSATDSHSLNNANEKTIDAMRGFESLVEKAEENSIQLEGSISVAFGCPYEGLVPIERHIEICKRYEQLGITDISLADTTGMANPDSIKRIIYSLKTQFPEFCYSLHLHNTRGMAFANAVAGFEEGIVDFDSSLAGLGGCPYAPNASGNIATEDLVHGFQEMGIKTNLNLDRIIEVAKKLQISYPKESESFILKAGKVSDLHIAPTEQIKLGK
ncbi:hydroxymethylglutaryl-CoA lyase [Sporosarcina ureilytica]|uniref:Hydroxymethylglutaryl-CoA lyase n=1 Tax=Sporosarcina ureilytica TaxID=298596 RepID=A0A1D8JFD5_9BACL|nr:hydroxymethylglutaryl-CoA lyase [Sporosarcina ureilytica]AOV07426.1 hydroxymethylglutaryl-CoA lyase [Sporosarcina ureilytica]